MNPSGRLLAVTFAALVVLALASWIISATGAGGTTIALAIAAAKTLGIALVFMELAYARPSDRVIAAVAVFFVILLCVGTLADVALR